MKSKIVPLRATHTDECVEVYIYIYNNSWLQYYMEVIGQLYNPAVLSPRKTPPATRLIGNWLSVRTSLDALEWDGSSFKKFPEFAGIIYRNCYYD